MQPSKLIEKATNNFKNIRPVWYPRMSQKERVDRWGIQRALRFPQDKRVQKHSIRGIKAFLKFGRKNKRKLRDPSEIGELLLVLVEKLTIKDALGKLYKSTTQNQSHFHKDEIFVIRKFNKNGRKQIFILAQKRKPRRDIA